ncbi:MAG TPA: chemotaxis protein CheB [Polyangiaceae bacterium]|nr:chemotaxis protein CheB [Polyangiaceae bacterium]
MTTTTGEKRDTIVIGASAGGIEALQRLLPAFTARIEASVFVVMHLPADGHSALDRVLARSTEYETAFAKPGEPILPGRVYVAPPDRHLLIDDDRVELWHGARENRSRPAVDPLFRSAAVARRGRVMAAVLSGLLDDGAAGIAQVQRCGGLAVVQAPDDAIEPEMPEHALFALGGRADAVLSAAELGEYLAERVGTPAPPAEVPPDIQRELDMLLGSISGLEALSKGGPPLALSCPECGGPLWGVRDGRVQRFRCHTGHTYGVDGLLSSQGTQIEQALWAAIKGLEQRSQLLRDLAREESSNRRLAAGKGFDSESKRLSLHAQTLRDVLVASVRELAPAAAPGLARNLERSREEDD